MARPTGSIEPSNFHLFEIIKKHLAGKRFVTDVFVFRKFSLPVHRPLTQISSSGYRPWRYSGKSLNCKWSRLGGL